MSKLKINLLTHCWEFQNDYDRKGYGKFFDGKDKVLAHRFSYKIHNGYIPKDYEIDHICRIRHCVNPNHLQALSKEEHKEKTTPYAVAYNQSAYAKEASKRAGARRRKYKDLPEGITMANSKAGTPFLYARFRCPVTNVIVRAGGRRFDSPEEKLEAIKFLCAKMIMMRAEIMEKYKNS